MTAEPARNAGIVSRLVAGLIDYLVAAVILAGAYAGVAFFMFLLDFRRLDISHLQWWFTTSSYLMVLVLYLFLCWATSGRTVGAVVMGVRVTNRRGGRLDVPRALLRAFACVVFPVGLLWVAFSAKRLSLQDVTLRTRVVYTH